MSGHICEPCKFHIVACTIGGTSGRWRCELSSLSDRYTSLGGRENTLPNPHLWNPASPFSFDPAYLLKDEEGKQERAARISLHRK